MTALLRPLVGEDRGPATRHGVRVVAVVCLMFGLAAALVITRGYPTTVSDTGVFLSVGAEILNGARLYAEVSDNKDPVFYYSQALALLLGGWRGPFAMDVLWVGFAGCGMLLLTRRITRSPVAALLAGVLYMLLLTGVVYNAGYSGLPGLALLPFVAYAASAQMPFLAGMAVAFVGLTKANLVIVAVAVVAVAMIDSKTEVRQSLARAVSGAVALLGFVAIVFAASGQLGPYLAQLRSNAAYSSDGLKLVHGAERPFGHLAVAWEHAGSSLRYGVIAAIALAVVFASLAGWPARVRRTGVLALSAATGTVAMVGLTHIWDHHLQLIAFALTCLGVFLCVAVIDTARRFEGRRGLVFGVGVALALGVAWGAVDLQRPSTEVAERWRAAADTSVSDALVAAAGARGDGRPHTWFHLGGNEERGAAAFLPAGWTLSCPQFHQYMWLPERTLEDTRNCIDRERPQYVAVTPAFDRDLLFIRATLGAGKLTAPWVAFNGWARSFLDRECTLREERPGVRVFSCGGGDA